MSQGDEPRATPLPRRHAPTLRVDSIAEEYATVDAYPSENGWWSIVSQNLVAGEAGPIDRLVLRPDLGGDEATIDFDVASFVGMQSVQTEAAEVSMRLDVLMKRALDFARENPPFHPGSLPRFPVPSMRYRDCVEVALAILAFDGGRRGLYAPTRVVALQLATGEPIGIGDAPGFNPHDWPPPRLGDWPPSGDMPLGRRQLQATVSRFSACYLRLLDAEVQGRGYPQRTDEEREVGKLIINLEVPAMMDWYRKIHPDWMSRLIEPDGPHQRA